MSTTLRHAGLLLAIALALAAQQLVADRAYPWWPGWTLFALAALVAAVAAPALDTPGTSGTRDKRRPRAVQLLPAAAALAATAGTVWLSSGNQRPGLALLLWLASFVLASLAVIGTIVAPARSPTPWSRREVCILMAICILGLVARTVWLDDVPRYYFDDESRVGMYLRHVFDAPAFPNVFTMGWNTWPVVGMVLQGIFASWLGLDTTSLRLSSAVSGTIAVLFTYLLARELFSPRIAVLSGVLFACARTALDFSRMGVCHVQVVLFETLAFACLWRALNTGSGLSYLWTGIGLGLCLYTYNAGQLVPLLWLGWIVLAFMRMPRAALHYWRGTLITVVGLLITVLPFLLYVTDHFTFGAHWQEYTGMARNRQEVSRITEAWTSLGPSEGLRILGQQARLTWLGFNVLPADAYLLGYRGGGMLDHVSAPLFVLGLAIALAHLWRPRYAFLVYWWLLTMIAGGVLTQAPPAYVRTVGVLPALAVLGALPLDAFVRTGEPSRWRPVAYGLTALLAAIMAWDNFRTYFVAFPRESSQPSSELTRYLRTTPPDTLGLLIGAEHHLEFGGEIFALNLSPRRFANVGEPAQFLPLREPADTPIALIFGETQLTLVPYAQSLYPGTTVTEGVNRGGGETIFRAMVLSPAQIAGRQGLEVVAHDDQQRTLREAIRADPFSDKAPFDVSCHHLTWSGSVYWPTHEPVTLHVEAPPTTRLSIGATSLPGTRDAEPTQTVPLRLPRGWVPIWIEERCTDARRLSLAVERDGRTVAFARRDLRPDHGDEGLLATYTRREVPLLQTIDSHINAFAIEELLAGPYNVPVFMPFTVTWSGSLEVYAEGEYQLEAVFSGPMLLTLDGEPLLQEQVKIPEEPRTARVTRRLSQGPHALFALWDSTRRAHTSRRIFQLFWRRPDGTHELIPPPYFRPAASSAGSGVLPTISIPPTPTPIAVRSGPRQALTELTASKVEFGFAPPRINKSWGGPPISMRGIEYDRGIGVHAWTRMTYAVPPNAVEFQAIVGLSDDAKECPRASVRFEVRNERGTALYDSGVIDIYSPPMLASAPLAGASAITLVVTDADDGIDCDHANWAEPTFLLK